MTKVPKRESQLSIGHGCDEDEAQIRAFFNTIAGGTPPDQKDPYFDYLIDRFGTEALGYFIHPQNKKTISFVAHDDQGIVGVLFAERAGKKMLKEGGWLDAKAHMRVKWYGVRSDARGVLYNAEEYKISKLLLSFLKRELAEFDCERMEALVHINDFYTSRSLLDCGFDYRGPVSKNVKAGTLSEAASAFKYERYVL